MTISKQELAEGIRFAGRRAVAALEHVPDFDRQLAQEWTTAEAFRHIAAGAGGLEGFYGRPRHATSSKGSATRTPHPVTLAPSSAWPRSPARSWAR